MTRQRLIEPTLMKAITALGLPASATTKLIVRWAEVIVKNKATAERIRADVRAHPDGFFRSGAGPAPAEPPLSDQRRP